MVTSRSTGVELIWPDRPSAAKRASRRDSTVGRGETGSGGEAIFHKVDHCNRLVLTDHTIFSTTQAGTVSCKNNERVHPNFLYSFRTHGMASFIPHRSSRRTDRTPSSRRAISGVCPTSTVQVNSTAQKEHENTDSFFLDVLCSSMFVSTYIRSVSVCTRR